MHSLGPKVIQKIDRIPKIFSGVGGLGSRDVRPGDFIAIFKNMMRNDGKEKEFFVGNPFFSEPYFGYACT